MKEFSFLPPSKTMITIYNKLHQDYIDYEQFRELPFDVIRHILTFIKFPEIIFYSKKLIETAHYSDLYEKMLLYNQSEDAELHSDLSLTKRHKRTISPSSAGSLTKTIPFNIVNIIRKLFGAFEKERNQRVFLFDFYAHLKFIGLDQMIFLYNSFYRVDDKIGLNQITSPRSSWRRSRRGSYDGEFQRMLMMSPRSFETLVSVQIGAVQDDANINYSPTNRFNGGSLPKHIRNSVLSVSPIFSNNNLMSRLSNDFSQTFSKKRRSKSFGSSQIVIQMRKKLEQEEDHEQVELKQQRRFSTHYYEVRNYFYIPYIQSVTFSNCSNEANNYIHYVIIPFFRFNNHLKSFKLIDCQLSQESIQELYFQLRSMFISMYKSGSMPTQYYSSLRELSLADNELRHHCSWHLLFPNIRTLDLSGNKSLIEPSLFVLLAKDIENYKHLKRLNLSNGGFDMNMTIKNNNLQELDIFDIRQPMQLSQLETQIIANCPNLRQIKFFSAQEKKLVKWIRE